MRSLLVLLCLALTSTSNAEVGTNPNVDAVKATLEGFRDKLSTPELATLKAAVNGYLTAFGSANEKVNNARTEVKTLSEVTVPAIAVKLKPLTDKRDAYLAGTLREEEYKTSKESLDKLEAELAAARAKLLEKQTSLKPIEAEFSKAQDALTQSRKPIKDMEDRLLAAMAQSLATMTLQQNIDSVKMDGLEAGNKIDVIEAALADTVLENYVRAKMVKLLVSQDFCTATKRCTQGSSSYNAPTKEMKDVFPGRKTHQ